MKPMRHRKARAVIAADVLSPGEAKTVIAKVDADVRALDAQFAAKAVDKDLRRGWREFAKSWRDFYYEEKDNPMKGAARTALMFAGQLKGWRQSLSRARAGVGALVYTPGAIKDELETVQSGIRQLDIDIMSSSVRDAFKQSWKLFVAEWQKFYDTHQSWTSRMWYAAWEKTTEYRRRVDEWREAFHREGGVATAPALVTPPEPGTATWKWMVAGGLVTVGVVLGAKALR